MLELERLWRGVRVVVGTALEVIGTLIACVGMLLVWGGQTLWYEVLHESDE